MILTDRQRGLLMFFKNRQLPEDPSLFLPQPIVELEDAIQDGRNLEASSLRQALIDTKLLEHWDGIPLPLEES